MIRRHLRLMVTATRFPRVSGDDPLATQDWNQIAKFSPRERG